MYEKMIRQLEADLGKKIQTGIFGADMKVELLNDGPVTIVIDTKNKEWEKLLASSCELLAASYKMISEIQRVICEIFSNLLICGAKFGE